MGYITLDYYRTDYLGIDPGNEVELTRYINRASDMVDLLTDGKAQSYDGLYPFQQVAIQKATAAMAEFFVENGDTFNESGASSESAGGWSWSGGGKTVSPMTISFLEQADLMRSAIPVSGDVTCEAN